ncbi:hypothetical protein BGZ70_001922 [Mortierella alpina]|uniref:Uncharacterized protein n=1 Tax=Mortierella alpina TaxID=64518 RepID=A0A9P6LWI4_MORAP|nr:hypothetical protein BGZ70_001922 [Mortierella alpina]
MLQLHTSLFQDLPQDDNNDDDEGVAPSQEADSSDSENDDSDNDNEDEDDERDGRERSTDVVNLASLDPSVSSSTPPGDSPALSLQAEKRSKRIRVDPSAPAIAKRVRFDESRNTVHLHYRNSSVTPPGSPEAVYTPTSQPLAPALIRRQSSSPDTFSLSLENTSQEVIDFASSLTRLMGGGPGSASQSESSALFGLQQRSPLSSFNSFQASPPSPVRPTFLSYSPPPSSSLSSSWSPTFEDDNEDESMNEASLSPTRPTFQAPPTFPRSVAPAKPRFPAMLKREASNASFLDSYPISLAPETVPESSATPRNRPSPSSFTPRRPRVNPGASLPGSLRSNASARPRLPAMLKREASHASFLDSCPASLAPEQHRLSTPPRESSGSPVTFVVPTLRKCLSDLSANTSQRPMAGSVPQLKRTRSFSEDGCKKPSVNKDLSTSFGSLFSRPSDAVMSLLATPPDSQLM